MVATGEYGEYGDKSNIAPPPLYTNAGKTQHNNLKTLALAIADKYDSTLFFLVQTPHRPVDVPINKKKMQLFRRSQSAFLSDVTKMNCEQAERNTLE